MIYLEYPEEIGLPQKAVDESEGQFEFGDQLFKLPYRCGNCGQPHEIVFAFQRLQPHDDGPKKVYRFGGISI